MRARRYNKALLNIYKPAHGTDDEGWGVETTEYEYVGHTRGNYITSAAMSGGTRQLHHGREEMWGIWETVLASIPFVGEGYVLAIRGPVEFNEKIWIVRKRYDLGRNRCRLILDEVTSMQGNLPLPEGQN